MKKFVVSSFRQCASLACHVVDELKCDHKEVDTRMLTHASNASQFYDNIVIRSSNTDVLLIALNAGLEINANLFFKIGVGNGELYQLI